MMVDVKSYQRGLNGILSDPFYAKLREMSKIKYNMKVSKEQVGL